MDTHDNTTIYLHGMPNDDGQNALFELVGGLYDHWRSYGIPINHPRKSYFHMTLARVTHDYPVDTIIEEYQYFDFGMNRLCTFGFDACNTIARDC